jgi:acyl-CoA reductase-like NAD-dependent aldehyde dehydrogenase
VIAPRYPLYLAGRAHEGTGDLAVTDKTSGAVVSQVARADAALIDAALDAAQAARAPLGRLPAWARQRALEHCATRLRERADELAAVLCVEAGKPIRDARGEVGRLIETFKIAAEEAVRPPGEVLELGLSPRTQGSRGLTRRVPVGVCSFITPFNFPLNLVAHKVAPAVAAGCPFVLKPSERTPVGALLIASVLAETDLPAGAFSVLPCRVEDAGPFVEDPRIALLSFTGGQLGWQLRARAGRKKVVLELGGNAACIVDADQGPRLAAVVERLVFGAFYQSGQSCISVQRILAHAAVYDELRDRLVVAARALRVGDPRDETTSLGPLIDEAAAERLSARIARAVAAGARVLCGGARRGAFLDASVLEDVPPDQPLAAEEAFGPVVLLERVASFDEALTRANASRFGLQAGVFTNDLAHALRAWDELEVGGVIVGDVPSFRVDSMPYGGVKDSGVGREGVRSAIEEMTETRLLVLRGS